MIKATDFEQEAKRVEKRLQEYIRDMRKFERAMMKRRIK